MKKILTIAAAIAFMTSCGVAKSPLTGGAYMNVKDGLAVTSNAGSSKVGTAEAKSYLGLVAMGDASIQAAAKSAGISRIHHVDYQTKSYVSLYSVYTIIVYGE